MIRRYQHVSITVSDLDRSIAWYRDMMGFEPQGAASEAAGEATSRALGLENVRLRLATLVQGDCLLELIQYLSPPGVEHGAAAVRCRLHAYGARGGRYSGVVPRSIGEGGEVQLRAEPQPARDRLGLVGVSAGSGRRSD